MGLKLLENYGWFSHRVGSQYTSFERVLAFTCVLNIRRVRIEPGGKRAKILLWLITWWFWLCCCCIWYWILYEMASWEEWWPELRILLQNMRSGWLLLLLFTSKVCGRISLERCFWIRKRKQEAATTTSNAKAKWNSDEHSQQTCR